MTSTDAKEFQDRFFARCPGMRACIELMAVVPKVVVYAKDFESRYVFNNEYHRHRYGGLAPEELIGRRASEFFPPLLGAAYEANDRAVLDSGEPVRNQIWLVPTLRGTPGWFLSGKSPIFDREGDVIGLLGVMHPIAVPEEQQAHYGSIRRVIDYLDANYTDEIDSAKLAKMAGLSVSQFNRRFRQLLRISPMEYLLSVRIQEAQQLLATTGENVGDIAAATGFCDQSHFTKRFRKVTGVAPLQYRKEFREPRKS